MDILAAETGWTDLSNMGQNGREIPAAAPAFPADTDLLIVMLGTNDLLRAGARSRPPGGWSGFLSGVSLDRSKDPADRAAAGDPGRGCPTRSSLRSPVLCTALSGLAEQLGILFADAGRWDIPWPMTAYTLCGQGHKAFAAGLLEELK